MSLLIGLFFLAVVIGWIVLVLAGPNFWTGMTTGDCGTFGILTLVASMFVFVPVGAVMMEIEVKDDSAFFWAYVVSLAIAAIGMSICLRKAFKGAMADVLKREAEANPPPVPGPRPLPPGLARYYENRERNRHCA